MQHTAALCRALGINPGLISKLDATFSAMNERILDAPTVFGHYSPLYRIPGSPLFGPEFKIYSPSEAVNRANFFYSLISRPGSLNPVLQPFVPLASNPPAQVAANRRSAIVRAHVAGDARRHRQRAAVAVDQQC